MGEPKMAGRTKIVESQTITRPADTTAYTSGDLVANSTTAGSVVPFLFENVVRTTGYRAKIKRASLNASGVAITNGSFRLHLFSATPAPVGAGDNAAIAADFDTNAAKYVGYLDIVLVVAGTGGNKGWSVTAAPDLNFVSVNSKNLWGLLEAKAGYTPASAETFKIELEVEAS